MKKALFVVLSTLMLGACVNVPQPPKLDIVLPVAGTNEVWNSASHKGSPVLVAVMASYCGWCKKSLAALETANAEFKDKGVEIVGIYVDDNVEAVKAIQKQYGLKTTILYQGGQTAQDLGVNGFPNILLFDKKHKLVKVWSGYSDRLADEYRREINKLLK